MIPHHPGLASIAGTNIKYGYQVKVGYLPSEDQYEQIAQDVLSFEPAVVGFTTVETQLIYVQRLAAQIKESQVNNNKYGRKLKDYALGLFDIT